MSRAVWYKSQVKHGNKIGRTLGYPTVNLDAALLAKISKTGVYASTIIIDGQSYAGALYIGPRLVLGENVRVLEIFILDFEGELYGKTLEFKLDKFIRPPIDFADMESMKRQLEQDVSSVQESYR